MNKVSPYWQYLRDALQSDLRLISCIELQNLDGQTLPCHTSLTLSNFDTFSRLIPDEELELSLVFEAPLSAESVYRDMLASGHANQTLNSLYESENHDFWLRSGLSIIDRCPALAFRLTLFKHCLPHEYARTVFCLWLIVLEGNEVNRDQEDFELLFLSGLVHDLGLLNVDPKYTAESHDPRSSKNDELGYYAHVSFSAEFLSRTLCVNENVDKSIRQHHENMDGTGYPLGITGKMLSEYGQHIHLYDTLFSIYSRNYEPLNKTLADLVPIIEINAVTHFGQSAVRLIELLKKAPRSKNVFFSREQYQGILEKTESMGEYIERSSEIIKTFTANVGFRHEDKTLFMLQNSFIHIALAYYKLRIMYKQAMLSDALSDDGDYERLSKVLEDNFFSLREIIFHINKFLYRLRIYRTTCSNEVVNNQAGKTIDALSQLTVKLIV